MIGSNKVLALIPARAGSKGLPGKNIRPLLGKPLINWTVEAALASNYLDRVLVSTDDEGIREIAVSAGASAPFIRPIDLAGDTSSSVDVVLHALDYCEEKLHEHFDYVILLEPTSPIRMHDDIDKIIEKLHSNRQFIDAVVSLGLTSHHPSLLKQLIDGSVRPFEKLKHGTERRQELSAAYFPFGVGYAIKTKVLREFRTFYPDKLGGFEIQRHQEFEIDDYLDFICVEAVLREKGRNEV